MLPKGSPASHCFVEEGKPVTRFYTVEVKGRDSMYQRPCPPSPTATEGNPAVSKALFHITGRGDLWGIHMGKLCSPTLWEAMTL